MYQYLFLFDPTCLAFRSCKIRLDSASTNSQQLAEKSCSSSPRTHERLYPIFILYPTETGPNEGTSQMDRGPESARHCLSYILSQQRPSYLVFHTHYIFNCIYIFSNFDMDISASTNATPTAPTAYFEGQNQPLPAAKATYHPRQGRHRCRR